MSGANIVIRCDASRLMGSGHVMRCLSLADALRARGVSVQFVCRLLEGNLRDLIVARGFGVTSLPAPAADFQSGAEFDHATWLGASWQDDAHQTREAIGALASRPTWLIVDHYALDHLWERELHPAVERILVIDDLADRQHDCDLLLDQNLYADAQTRYVGKAPERCRLLLGPRYAVLRAEFAEARANLRRPSGGVKRILVFFGGADAGNCTAVAIRALAGVDLRDISVDVVVGSQQHNRDAIEAACNAHGFRLHVQTDRMAELMSAADLAVGAGGSAHWERCCVGLPCVAFSLAANQSQLVHDAALAGLLYAPDVPADDSDALARHLQACIENPLLIAAMSHKAMATVDGRGTQRVLRAMGIFSVSVREAGDADCKPIFAWRNHPAVRAMSRNGGELEWSAHEAWFGSVLGDSQKHLLIGESAGQAIGIVRFDVNGAAAEVSIYMVPGQSHLGLGADLLQTAEQWLTSLQPQVHCLCAEVLDGNESSHRLFLVSGYAADITRYTKRL